ncbi:MAG TPA: APC family permease [Thermoplasmataceae archaeon]|nr:APC family permease [Thermoplasmatales archaeon AK]HLH85981.1 APC family permease [Thermoplasmataceae archaeon]
MKKDQLGLRHAISQAVALNAPGGTIVLYITSTASLIGFTFTQYPSGALAIPLILILSLVIYGLMSFSMYEFSKKLSSSGGYYTFVSRGLGNSAGFLTAISYVSYQMLSFTGFGILGFISFLYGVLPSVGVNIPYANYLWIPVALAFLGLVAGLIYSGIRPSLRFVSYTITIEIGFFLITSVALLVIDHHSISSVPFTPKPLGNNILYVSTMMIYAIGTFVGIGGALPVAEETKNPKKNVPVAILSTIAILGVTIILAAYAQLTAWPSISSIANFGGSSYPYPVLNIYQSSFGSLSFPLFILLVILVANSYFTATVSLGTNASRVLFSMSREKVIDDRISKTHHRTGTPTNAVLLVALISAVVVIATGLVFEGLYPGEPVNALTFASLFLLILESPVAYLIHILTNTSLAVYIKKEKMKLKLFRQLIIPTISTITLIFAIIVAIEFNLSAPYIYGVYGAIIWIAFILGLTLFVRMRHKARLELIGDFSL